jgi:heme-degrading monooxygenase HmoA
MGEITVINVKPGRGAAFEEAVAARGDFHHAKGWRALVLHRSQEIAGRYRRLVTWDTVESHTVDFRPPPDFQAWRAPVGECFVRKLLVQHANLRARLDKP